MLVLYDKASILSSVKPRYPVASGLLLLVLGSLILTGCPYGPFSTQRLDELHVSGTVTVNDPRYKDQAWYLEAINAPQAWFFLQEIQSSQQLNPVNVAIVDTTYDLEHEDLTGIFVTSEQYNAMNNTTSISPPESGEKHGTHVAGLIAARGDNNTGIVGAALNSSSMSNVSLVPVVALAGANGTGSEDGIIRSIDRVVRPARSDMPTVTGNVADVINMSLGAGGQASDGLYAAAATAVRNNIVLVAASGNDSQKMIHFPASIPEVIAVGSISVSEDGMFVRSGFSNYVSVNGNTPGAVRVDLVAPGGERESSALLSTVPQGLNGLYEKKAGTSMATPLVSATAALVRSVNPNLSATQVRHILIETAQKVWQEEDHPDRLYMDVEWQDWHPMYGYGMVDMDAAVRRAYQSFAFSTAAYSVERTEEIVNIPSNFWQATGPSAIIVSFETSNTTAQETKLAREEIKDLGFSVWGSRDGATLTITLPTDYPGKDLLEYLNTMPAVKHATQAQAVSFQ